MGEEATDKKETEIDIRGEGADRNVMPDSKFFDAHFFSISIFAALYLIISHEAVITL